MRPANSTLLVLASRDAGYLTPFSPANELALLVGGLMIPPVVLTSDSSGRTAGPIGIGTDAVERFYPSHWRIDDPRQLAGAGFEILTKALRLARRRTA